MINNPIDCAFEYPSDNYHNKLLDFHNKLLDFYKPDYYEYSMPEFPRHYSNFGPRFRMYVPIKCKDEKPNIYPPRFQINKVCFNGQGCVHNQDCVQSVAENHWTLYMIIAVLLVIYIAMRR